MNAVIYQNEKATVIKTKEVAKSDLWTSEKYQQTAVDAEKSQAQILVTGVGGGYSVSSKIVLSGRGVKADYGNGNYLISEAKLNQLKKLYKVSTDF